MKQLSVLKHYKKDLSKIIIQSIFTCPKNLKPKNLQTLYEMLQVIKMVSIVCQHSTYPIALRSHRSISNEETPR